MKLEELGLGSDLAQAPKKSRTKGISLGPQSEETDYVTHPPLPPSLPPILRPSLPFFLFSFFDSKIREGELNLDMGVAKKSSQKAPVRFGKQFEEIDYVRPPLLTSLLMLLLMADLV